MQQPRQSEWHQVNLMAPRNVSTFVKNVLKAASTIAATAEAISAYSRAVTPLRSATACLIIETASAVIGGSLCSVVQAGITPPVHPGPGRETVPFLGGLSGVNL